MALPARSIPSCDSRKMLRVIHTAMGCALASQNNRDYMEKFSLPVFILRCCL